MSTRSLFFILALGLTGLGSTHAADAPSGTLIDKSADLLKGKTLDGLLVNSAKGHVSAANLASADGDTMTTVEDIKDFTLLLKGFDKDFKNFGLSITPARVRNPLPRISLQDYEKGGLPMRMLGSLTLGYAQGKRNESGRDWERRAFSFETSAFLKKEEDPVIAMARSCGRAALDTEKDGADKPSAALTAAAAAAASAPATASPTTPQPASPVGAAESQAAAKAFNACIAPELKRLSDKWNRSRYSISYATGWIKPSDGSIPQESLGHTVAAAFLYGFDGIGSDLLREGAALSLVVRHSRQEPVISTLGTASLGRRNSTLAAIRLSGGSAGFRGLLEFSNSGKQEPTTSQRAFTQAAGIDYAVSGVTVGDLWLSVRYGKQRKITGSGTEAGTLLSLSYSGKPSLGF